MSHFCLLDIVFQRAVLEEVLLCKKWQLKIALLMALDRFDLLDEHDSDSITKTFTSNIY